MTSRSQQSHPLDPAKGSQSGPAVVTDNHGMIEAVLPTQALVHRWRALAAVLSAAAGGLVLFATRGDPRLSPDSITYLAVAEHLRHGVGLSDFTLTPLTVFPPVYPLVLAPGGASLLWVRVVGAVAMAVSCWLLFVLLEKRVRAGIALAAVVAFGASFGMVLTTSSTVSEPVCIALTLAMLVVLDREPLGTRACGVAGLLAALSFLTRYAAIGSLVTVVVVVAVTTRRWRPVVASAVPAVGLSGAWLVRNAVVAGTPMGPRFAGGANETLRAIVEQPLRSVGVAVGVSEGSTRTLLAGVIVTVVVMTGAVIVLRRRPIKAVDLGMICLAGASVAVPVLARIRTASDVSPRVMTPLLVAACYLGAVVVDTALRFRWPGRAVAALATVAIAWTTWQGVAYAVRFPDLPSSGDRSLYSKGLYDDIDALPSGTAILTNNPWGVWWQSRREPIEMAFTRPRVGNSHRPVEAAELVRLACSGPTALAWFSSMRNAGEGPDERRPDLLELVSLDRVATAPSGVLYMVSPLDRAACPEPAELAPGD